MLEDAAGEALSNMSAYEWLCQKSTESEVYLYWKMVIELEIVVEIKVEINVEIAIKNKYN